MVIPQKKGKINRKKNIELVSMLLPALAIVAVFSYFPMYGIQLAFKQFKAPKGIWGSPWIGLKNIEFFFKSNTLYRVVRNTIVMNLLFIVCGIAFSVLFAVLMYDVVKKWRVKLYQTTAMLPNFLSMVIVAYIVYALLKPNAGLINSIFHYLNLPEPEWYAKPEYWPFILVILRLWLNTGSSSIIFYACLMGVDSSILEAADIDGASKWQKRIYVMVPALVPIICIRLIMAVGGIFNGDFGLFYNVPRNIAALYPTTDVINTYVYRALFESQNVGMSAAVSLLQSVVGTIMLVGTNQIVKKISPENRLF